MKKILALGTGAAIAAIGAIVVSLFLVIVLITNVITSTGGAATAILGNEQIEQSKNGQCIVGGGNGNYSAMTANKTEYVKTIIGVAKGLNSNEADVKKMSITGIMVAIQESQIQVYANDGANKNGNSMASSLNKPDSWWLDLIKKSLNMPHDAVGNDADSLGIFQQRPSMGWADTATFKTVDNGEAAVQRLMNPQFSALAFYGGGDTVTRGLMDIPGWQSMDEAALAQAVQGSKYPSAYEQWRSEATELYNANKDAPKIDPNSDSTSSGSKSTSSSSKSSSSKSSSSADINKNGGNVSGSTEIKIPMPAGSYTFTSGFGGRDLSGVAVANSDGIDLSQHLGQDMAAPDGTPFYAPADGVVVATGLPTGNIKDGTWLIIDHEINGQKVSTEYAHMPEDGIYVKVGDHVKEGQKIGIVGHTGYASGPHLHVEIWVGGRFDGGHPVDPMKYWSGGNVDGNGTVGSSSGNTTCTAQTVGNTTGSGAAVTATGDVKDVIAAGMKYKNYPYSWGGGTINGPGEGFGVGAGVIGFDCSSLVRYMVYQGTGYELPRTSQEQYTATKGNTVFTNANIDASKLQPGDLLFYGDKNVDSSIHHIGMYIGDGKVLEALNPTDGIQITDLNYRLTGDFAAATRIDYTAKKAESGK